MLVLIAILESYGKTKPQYCLKEINIMCFHKHIPRAWNNCTLTWASKQSHKLDSFHPA